MANKHQVGIATGNRQRDVGAELLQAVRDIKSGKTGRVLRVEARQAGQTQTHIACRLSVEYHEDT